MMSCLDRVDCRGIHGSGSEPVRVFIILAGEGGVIKGLCRFEWAIRGYSIGDCSKIRLPSSVNLNVCFAYCMYI